MADEAECRNETLRNGILIGCASLLLIIAAIAWYSYVAQCMAWGAVYGLSGREGDLAQFAYHAHTALGIALISEGLAVAIAFRLVLAPVEPKWARLPACIILALLADFATIAIVRACA